MQQEGTAQNNERAYEQEPVTDVIAKREIPAGTTPIIEPASLWGEEPEEAVIKEPVAVKESSPQGARVSAPGGEAIAGEVQPVINFKEKLGSFGAAVGYIAGTVASLASAAGNKFVSKVGEVIEQKRVANSTGARGIIEPKVGEVSTLQMNRAESTQDTDYTSDSAEAKQIKKQMSNSNGDFIAKLGEMYRASLPQNKSDDIRNTATFKNLKEAKTTKFIAMGVGIASFIATVGAVGPLAIGVWYINYHGAKSALAMGGAKVVESEFVKDKVARFRGEKMRAHSIVSGSPENSQRPSPGPKV